VNEQLALSGLQHVEGWNTKIMQARPTGTTGGGCTVPHALLPLLIPLLPRSQLFETFNVRFGVVIVGPTGAGKTACYRTLAAAMTALRARGSANEAYQEVHMHVLNPKSISMGELYGEFNELTQVRRGRRRWWGYARLLTSPHPRAAPPPRERRRSGRTAWRRPSFARTRTTRRRTASGRCSTAPSTRCGSRT
jgi:hypothetical protein